MAAIVSCKKGSSGVIASGNTEFLIQQSWKISTYEQKINSSSYVDQFPSIAACSRDDEYKFDVNGTYQLTEGATKCNPSDPDLLFTGFWQFLQNEAILKMDNIQYTVNRLDNTTMILSDSSILAPDTTYNRITLIH
jgi:hypothetical protein